MVFPVIMYGCESWTVKKAECRRIDAFELWCWRRLLRVPWTARRSNLFILKISPGCSLEGMMLQLKLQNFGHLMRRVDSLEKTLMLGGLETGGEGDHRGWDGWMASRTQWTWVRVNSRSWWGTGRPGVLQFMGSQRVRHDWVTELKEQLIFNTCMLIYTHIISKYVQMPTQTFGIMILSQWYYFGRISGRFLSFHCSESESRSVVSDTLRPHGPYSIWNSPGQNTGVGSFSLLQGIFPTQGSNLGLLHCRWILYQRS